MKSCESAFDTVYERRASYRESMRSIFMMSPTRLMFSLGMLVVINLATVSGTSLPWPSADVDSQANRVLPQPQQLNPRTEMRVVAEGSQSALEAPFIAVIRDAETYGAVSRAAGNLPNTNVDFNTHILVAAFLGERNTGGYSVEVVIEQAGGTDVPGRSYIRIKEKAPQKGTMVPQLITYPFKVVSLELNPTASILIAPDSPWQQPMRHYLVTGGSLTMTGGIAGTTSEFKPQGNLYITRLNNLASVMFVVNSTDRPHSELADFATGVIDSDTSIKITRMSSDTFINQPNSGFRATVKSVAEGKLVISLASLPLMKADGYSAAGTIEATARDAKP